ncbi:hypothetical protein CXQ82_20810 [Pseudomonas sp. S09G 359]|nr:hypothetical protein CXQ82_20810 [Pseudomonas sp. S09G 359]
MKSKSEFFGWVVTGLYLVAIAVLAFWKRDAWSGLTLNEIGDFLAGAFGPIAFLWLVLGYIQQGRELKISSDALVQQAAELKNSVQQQADLVAVSREQNIAQVAAYNYERMRYEKSMNARIFFYSQGCLGVGEFYTHTFEIHNARAEVFDLQFMCKLPGNNFHGTYAVLARDEKVTVPFTFEMVDQDYSTILHCFYKTFDGRRVGFQMDLAISAEGQKMAITPMVKLADL